VRRISGRCCIWHKSYILVVLRSVVRVGGQLGVENWSIKVLSPDLEGRGASLGDRRIVLRVLVVGMREL